MHPRDPHKAYDDAKRRRDKIADMSSLTRAKQIAGKRFQQMDALLAQFEKDINGLF